MLRLRKILLCKYLYIGLFLFTLILTIIRLSIPIKSSYNENSKSFTGTVINLTEKEDYLTITLKNKKESTLVTINKIIDIELGEIVKVEGEFIKPNKNTYPNLFNYRNYLKRKNIFYLIEAKKIIFLRKSINPYYKIKQIMINHFHKNPYLYTFLLGDKSKVDQKVLESYQENGISHLFAISGMHISLLASIINKILKKKHLREEFIYKVTSITLISYLLLVGFSPSILRGVLFYLLFTGNSIYYFYIKPFHLFLTITSISLLINPNYIWDVGYQYSYFISLSLLLCSKELSSNNYIISLLKVSLLSFLVSLPISLYHFQQINLFSIIYNLFYVPLISFIIFPFSILVGIFPFLSGIYSILITILEKTSLFFSKISFGKLVFRRLPIIIYFIYFIILLCFLFKKKKILISILIILLFIHYHISWIDSSIKVTFIDVGQGDSILIQNKTKTILIDTGGIRNQSLYDKLLKDILKINGIRKINVLIITHGDFDHMGEAINLVNNFKVEKVIFNCGEYNDLEKELINVLDKKKIKYYSCIKELNIDNSKLYFLQTKAYDSENDNSNVIYTELYEYKFMFTGDASTTTEKEILNKYNLPDIDVLKVGHHGSKTSSSEEFINEINPKYSIISVGKNNRYGHPNKEALDSLKKSKIYRTDQNGSIIFKIKNNNLKIETCSP